jgi:hypothetical protein
LNQPDIPIAFIPTRNVPDEEYFYLSVLALKTIHLETEEEAEYVNEINSRKLYL